MNTQPSRPVITPAMREQAAKQPNTWLYVVDPIFTDPSAEVPQWGFIGGYRVDERGQLTDDFSPNPHYRPSPVALRLPAPSNDVERALQLTTTGYAQGQTLLAAMLDAELILFAQPQGSGLFTMEHETGRRQLQVFTSDTYLPSNWTTWQRMTGRQLATQSLTGVDLQINPTSQVKARIPGEDLMVAAGTAPPQQPGQPAVNPGTNGALRPVQPAPPETQSQPRAVPPPVPGGPPAPSAEPTASQPQAAAQAEKTAEKPTEKPAEAPGPDPAASELGQRFLGSLLASAIGDALGASVEFYPVEQIRSRFGERGVTDYDRSAERPGEFTDDTQMALFTLEGLIRGHLAVRSGAATSPMAAVQLAYQRWLHTQGYAWPRVAGAFAESHPEPDGWLISNQELFSVRSPSSSCISSLRDFASGTAPGTFEHAINDSKACGGVVRAAPVAVWSDHAREVFELGAATAALTDSDPSGYLPAGVLAVTVQQLLRGDSLTEALDRARSLLANYAGHEPTDTALQAAVDLAAAGKPTPEQIKDTLGGGWTGPEALAIGVCAALSTDSLAEAVMLAINHSGNSDSTGSVCGSIVGAMYKVDALPGIWLRDLKQHSTIEELGRDAVVEFGPKPRSVSDPELLKRYPVTRDIPDLVFTSTLPAAASKDEPAAPETAAAPEPEPAPAEAAPAEAEVAEQPAESAPELPVQRPALSQPELRAARIAGCLVGGATGDALGYPVEAESLEAIRVKHGPAGVTGFADGDRPGGSISDDTQMTLFTMEGLIRASIARRLHGETDPALQVQHAYQRWLHTQGFDWKIAGGPIAGSPPDGWLIATRELFVRRAPGTTCIQALHGYATGRKLGSLTEPVNASKGSGGVMRAAPAGMWPESPAEAFQAGAQTAALTHGHPVGYLPAGVLAVIVHQLLDDRSIPEAVDRALSELSTWDGAEEVTQALRKAIELAAGETPTAERIQEVLGSGSTGDQAIAIAVCAALTHPESFAEAVILSANHSGDTDSTAAICGNIMGTAHTVSGIPQKWRDALELRETIAQLAADAAREFGPTPPEDAAWLERYPVQTAPAPQPEEPQVPAAQAPKPESTVESQDPGTEVAASGDSGSEDFDDSLSDEELRLLTAWRKFRDGDDDGSSDLSQGLHKLLEEAFGPQRAQQLMGEATAAEEPQSDPEPETPAQLTRAERLAGCVLGAAAGDALGAPWMFAGLDRINQDNPHGVRTLSEAFGRPGAATAISQQTVFVLDGLIRAGIQSRLHNASPDWPNAVRTALWQWLSTQGVPVGSTAVHGALAESAALRSQRFPDEATVTALASQNTEQELPTAANPPNAARSVGATARSAVIGFRAETTAAAVSLGCEVAVTTHGHPDGYLPAGALAGVIRALADGHSLATAVQAVLPELDALEGSEPTTHALRSALELAAHGPADVGSLEKIGTGWNAPDALGIAVAAALSHPESYMDAVSLAATHSGNSAATSALCGAIMGASRGQEDIPSDWLETLELRKIFDDLVEDEQRVSEEISPDAEVPEWAHRYLA